MNKQLKIIFSLLLLVSSWFAFKDTVKAACSTVSIVSFSATPLNVTTASPHSDFTVRLTTNCQPADHNFRLFFNTTSTPGSTPDTVLFPVDMGQSHFTRNTNGTYDGLAEVRVQPFTGFPATTNNLIYYPRVYSPVENRVIAEPPATARQTITRNAAPTPTPPVGVNPIPTTTPTPATGNPPPVIDVPQIKNPTGAGNLSEFIARIIKILLTLIAMVAAIMVIVSGFRMVAYGGNPGELARAKSGLIWAILGLVIALMSFSIISIIQRIIE